MDPITQYILEGYIFSDKNISINLSKFESGKENKLIIIGVPGSGKTSLGRYLAKKYKVQEFISDDSWPNTKKGLLNNKRTILEGAGFVWLVHEPKWKDIVISKSIIFLGMSAIKAGLRADLRDGMIPGTVKDKRHTFHFIRSNFKDFQKRLNSLRKDALRQSGIDVKEYKIPSEVNKYLTGRM